MSDQPSRKPPQSPGLMPTHGGFRKLESFQVAQLAFDVTVRFCDRYIDKFSRTKDQMVKAARSGGRISPKAVWRQAHRRKRN